MVSPSVLAVALVAHLSFSCVSSASYGATRASYEVWAADQSNSAEGMSSLGVKGGYIWIWDSDSIQTQLRGGSDAEPLPCTPYASKGPCDILQVFSQRLVEYNQDGTPTGNELGDLEGFGRLHGTLRDPQNLYVAASLFTPGGGYVGIIDTRSKEAVALFRVTKLNFDDTSTRSVHMSFWTADGSAVIVSNLNGKAIERVNVERDGDGNILSANFDKSATLGLGKGMSVAEDATYFGGRGAFGTPLVGKISGSYSDADLQDLTPNGACKENDCGSGPDGKLGGRPNNLPICPIPSENDLVYITLAGGGLLIADSRTTPMSIVGEYGNAVQYGAGCSGAQAGDKVFLNAGVSASGSGASQSMFGLFAYDDTAYSYGSRAENDPMPDVVYRDSGNTLSLGNPLGNTTEDTSGQIPGSTTRRDSHGAAPTGNGKFVHVVDRIQNVVENFESSTYKRLTFDLTSDDGKSGRKGKPGACQAKSVTDDAALTLNDPSPDLMEATSDSRYLMIAFRGPAPVSVPHAGQGSCPGVGVVELKQNTGVGKLVGVLRSTNTVPDSVEISEASFPGGTAYSGAERSDVHGAVVVSKQAVPTQAAPKRGGQSGQRSR